MATGFLPRDVLLAFVRARVQGPVYGHQLHRELAELPTLCLKKVWKLGEVLGIRVTAGHWPAQAQEEPDGWGRFSRFCLESQKFFAK